MYCHACRCHVSPTPPKTIWKALTLFYWVGSLTVAVLFSLALGLNLVLAPAAIFVGMAVGTAARRLSSWTCPRCDAEMVEPEPAPAASRDAYANPARPLAPATHHA